MIYISIGLVLFYLLLTIEIIHTAVHLSNYLCNAINVAIYTHLLCSTFYKERVSENRNLIQFSKCSLHDT